MRHTKCCCNVQSQIDVPWLYRRRNQNSDACVYSKLGSLPEARSLKGADCNIIKASLSFLAVRIRLDHPLIPWLRPSSKHKFGPREQLPADR